MFAPLVAGLVGPALSGLVHSFSSVLSKRYRAGEHGIQRLTAVNMQRRPYTRRKVKRCLDDVEFRVQTRKFESVTISVSATPVASLRERSLVSLIRARSAPLVPAPDGRMVCMRAGRVNR